MKRLLLPLLAALALPTAVSAEYFFREDLMTDEKIHTVIHSSTTKTPNSIGIQEKADIVLVCKVKGRKADLEAYITTPT